MRLFTCTDIAEQFGASRNKLYIVTSECQEFGTIRYKGLEFNITAEGVQHEATKAMIEPRLLQGTLNSVLRNVVFSSDDEVQSCLQKPDLVFSEGMFFKWIEIFEVEDRITLLKQNQLRLNENLKGLFPADRAWAKEKIASSKAFAEFEHVQAMKELSAKF